jgi:large subunit ribosomal protein L10
MKREEKDTIIENLVQHIQGSKHFYVTDTADLNAAATSALRRKCFENKVELIVVKNTLLRKALEKVGNNFDDLYDVLTNSTSIMLTDTANVPARMIKEFRKTNTKPVLKAAYVEESIYIGDNQLDTLASLKSKNELIGDIIGLLQSPSKNVISALQSGKNTLAGVVKTLSEKQEK